MTRDDVMMIIAELVENYLNFDDSDAEIDRHYKYLSDFPFEPALQNVQQHIMTCKWPPTIADIRGQLGDQMDSQRSKAETAEYFAQLDKWRASDSPPPDGYWEKTRQLLRGGGS